MILQKYITIMPDIGAPNLTDTDLLCAHNIIKNHLAANGSHNTKTGGILKMVQFQFLKMMGEHKSWREIKEWFKEADKFLEEIEGL